MRSVRFLSCVVMALVWMSSPAKGEGLPDDARKLLAEWEQEVAAIQQKADQDARASTEKFIEPLQKLQDTYTKAGKLDEAVAIRDRIRELRARTVEAQPDPGTLGGLRG